MPENSNPNRARDHLANERTFLAWVRTGVATIVFGFAIGRFSFALREFMKLQGYKTVTPGFTTWLGIISTIGGVLLIFAGLHRYRAAKVQIDTDTFEPAEFVIDLVSYLLGTFGLVLAGYLVYIELANR
ncbi:MAG: YidH family protein [Terriglobales bacterium]|jgi:putative membrane protein